jgi:phospholipid-binding lipoprotein MlaA
VLPLLGPSNPRDTTGLVADYGLSIFPFFVNQFILLGVRGVDVVNARAQVLEEVRDAKSASLDYYTFVRNAYFQRRKALVNDGQEEKNGEDIYQVDEDLVQ